jgi:hypothetical protein
VFLGLLFELPEILHDTLEAVRGLRGKPEHPLEGWRRHCTKLAATLGWILIVVGVGGEFVTDSFVSKADGLVRQFDEILLAEAQNKSAHAEAIARGFDAQIAESNAKAKSAEATAEAERLARVKIEAAVAWRQLSDQDKRDIGAALTGFKSLAAVGIWFNASSTEAELFADDIAEALRSGDIVTNAPGGMMEMRESSGKFREPIVEPMTGVRVQSTKDEAARKFATLFIAELNRRGFDAIRQKDPPFGESKIPQIWVTVEPRPKGPQGEYKLQAEQDAKVRKQTRSK